MAASLHTYLSEQVAALTAGAARLRAGADSATALAILGDPTGHPLLPPAVDGVSSWDALGEWIGARADTLGGTVSTLTDVYCLSAAPAQSGGIHDLDTASVLTRLSPGEFAAAGTALAKVWRGAEHSELPGLHDLRGELRSALPPVLADVELICEGVREPTFGIANRLQDPTFDGALWSRDRVEDYRAHCRGAAQAAAVNGWTPPRPQVTRTVRWSPPGPQAGTQRRPLAR